MDKTLTTKISSALAAPTQTTLQPAELAPNAFFGFSISADGNRLAVGAPQFQSPHPMFTDQFGMSVALQGNTLLVGAPKSNTTGQVFEFRLANGVWQHQQPLIPEPNDVLFGATLAFHRNAIGSGAINTWSAPARIQLAKVLSFGGALAIQDDTMIIGAPHANAAFIYTRAAGVWSQTTALAPVNNYLYGWSVAINNGRIAVGAPLARQDNASGSFQALYGQNIALPDNNTTIVASPGWNTETEQFKGAVYIYQK